ncbi:MAG: acetate--CoA ligase family protein [Acidimicrobiaceae bacterium]|nr:acetate--CoA ligase family protein [Acidimicrobiaceae bacterium]
MTSRLDRLLRPRSLAFIGGAAAELAIDASRSFGFSGDMWAVNRSRELRGLPTFASVDELPAVDAAFVGVGRDAAVEVVRRLAAAGTGAAVCHASGFAETGEAGAALQAELVAAAAGMPVVGPNCYGTLSALTGAALWPDVHGLARCERGIALLSQSGNIAVSLTMQRRGLDIAWVMTLGNQADLGISEAFEAVAADDATTGVGLCIEELDDTERFVAAAASARRRGLPVVALKLGASETSGAIAVTHTASLVGDDAAYDALFRRLGIRRVHTLPELLDTLAALCALGPLRGSRLVSLSCSGGEAALVADRSRGRGLSFPPFAPDHADRVASALDGRVAVTNPLDYHTFIWGDEARLTGCFKAALGAEGQGAGASPFDAALLVIDFPAEGLDRSRWWPTLRAFSAACSASSTPGVVAASLAENLPEEARARAATLGLAVCGDIDTALSALEAAAAWGQQAHTSCPSESLLPPSPPWSPSPGTWSSSLGRGSGGPGPEAGAGSSPQPERPYGTGVTGDGGPGAVLSEYEAKRRLAAAGIPVPAGTVVAAGRARAAAAEIGYPVVVKAIGLAHKTEAAGVVVGLEGPEEVAAAARRLAGDGGTVMVESCISGTVAELLVSVRSAPPVGMLLTLGAGGTLAELLDDTASLLLPASAQAVREALHGLRIWPLLAGHRGGPPAAVDEVVAMIGALGALVRDDRGIIEVEINPLVVTPRAALAADALMLVAESSAHG